MASYNRVIIMGNLTRDPDSKQLPSGQSVCRLSIASNREFKNRQTGSSTQEVCYVDVDVWGAQAESCKQYLQKGRAVLVDGRLKYDTWEDADGKKRDKHSIVANSVVFLASAAGQNYERGALEAESSDEAFFAKDVLKQMDQQTVKPKKQTKKATKQEASSFEDDAHHDTDELIFQDEPPFKDELPF
ncbi:MAG: single-stranded DNA-binding protein [Candidatus Babeliales bacterium]